MQIHQSEYNGYSSFQLRSGSSQRRAKLQGYNRAYCYYELDRLLRILEYCLALVSECHMALAPLLQPMAD